MKESFASSIFRRTYIPMIDEHIHVFDGLKMLLANDSLQHWGVAGGCGQVHDFCLFHGARYISFLF